MSCDVVQVIHDKIKNKLNKLLHRITPVGFIGVSKISLKNSLLLHPSGGVQDSLGKCKKDILMPHLSGLIQVVSLHPEELTKTLIIKYPVIVTIIK